MSSPIGRIGSHGTALVVTCALALGALGGCSEPSREEAREAVEAATQDVEALRAELAASVATLRERVEGARVGAEETTEELVAASRTRLQEIESDLAALRETSAELSGAARQETSEAIEELRAEVEKLRRAIDDMARQELGAASP